MPGTVSTERDGHVAVVELVAPEPNFLDVQLLQDLADELAVLDEDRSCRAVVLCTGGRHFSAGADFGEGGIGSDRPAAAQRLYGAAARLFDLGTPVVAAVQGAAVGAGLGLACAADFRVGSLTSRLHANFARLGFHAGFALTFTLPRIVGHQVCADLLYSGRRLDGAQAAAVGLLDRLVEPGQEREVALRWAHELAAAAPLAVRSMRQTLRADHPAGARAAMARELAEQTWLWETEDCRLGIAAAADRTDPVFTGR